MSGQLSNPGGEVSAGELAAARDMVMPRGAEGAEALVEGLDEVRTVHDLRGWAEQMLRALLRHQVLQPGVKVQRICGSQRGLGR